MLEDDSPRVFSMSAHFENGSVYCPFVPNYFFKYVYIEKPWEIVYLFRERGGFVHCPALKNMPSFIAKVGQICFQPIIKDPGSLSLVFFTCDISHLCEVLLGEGWEKGKVHHCKYEGHISCYVLLSVLTIHECLEAEWMLGTKIESSYPNSDVVVIGLQAGRSKNVIVALVQQAS